MKKHLTVALLALSCTAFATTVPWRVNVNETASRTVSAYRGETLVFEPEFVENGTVLSNLTCTLCYQTNGMGSVWWTVPGTTFAPTNDIGAASYRFFIRATSRDEVNYRANGILKLLGSPGATVNKIEMPVETIDFALTEPLNAPWATTNALADAIAAIDVTDQLKAYATTNALAEAAQAATNYTDAAVTASDAYLRTDIWSLGYEPYNVSTDTTASSTTNLHGKIVSIVTRTETRDGYVRLLPYYLAPFTRTVSLVAAEVTDGPGEIVDGQPLVIHGTSTAASNVTARATTAGGETRSVTFTLSSAAKKVTTESSRYTDDESDLGIVREETNDKWLASLSSDPGETVSDSSHGETTEVYKSAYFRDDSGVRTDSTPYLCFNVYRNNTTALLPGYKGGRNTGNGGSFVIGKRLLGNAAHWWGGVWAGRACYVETSDGTLHTLTMSGNHVNLGTWAIEKWGREGFKEKFGFDVGFLSDIRVIEVNEDIPDECIPALLPYAEAAKTFEATGDDSGNLDLSCGGFTLGQNNSIYPVWFATLTAYNSNILAASDGGVTVREDCFARFKAAPCYWTVRDGESGRPTIIVTANAAILAGAYHTVSGGSSYICAADVIAEYERELGRDPDETLKRVTADDL